MDTKKWLTDEEYTFIFNRVPRLCVDPVIKTAAGVVLTLRDIEPYKGQWHLPGGVVHKGETVEQAAKRLAKKETGLDIEIGQCLGFMEFPDEKYADRDIHTISIALEAIVTGGELKNDPESKQVAYHLSPPANIVATHLNFLQKLGIF